MLSYEYLTVLTVNVFSILLPVCNLNSGSMPHDDSNFNSLTFNFRIFLNQSHFQFEIGASISQKTAIVRDAAAHTL